jgi:hypothetical protein
MHQVEWLESAVQELANIWMNADSKERARITAATESIDETICRNPEQQGESRPGGRRIFFALPLGVNFRIENDSPTVVVTHVWHVRKDV